MSDLVPRLTDTLESLHDGSRQIPRELTRAVRAEQARALARAARVEGAAYVMRTALMNVALLSQEEEACLRAAPLGEARYKAIVDAYALYAAREAGRV